MDITDVRAQNVKKILDALRFQDGLTKREIAAQTGLSFSTVSPTCNELRAKGILRESKLSGVSVGRLPGSFSFQRDRFAVCCVDLQNVKRITIAVMDLGGRLLNRCELTDTTPDTSTVQRVNQAAQWFHEYSASEEGSSLHFIRVCIAVTGIYDIRTGMLLPNPINPDPCPLLEIAQTAFQLPCLIDSGSNFCAMAIKQRWPQDDDFIYLHLSESVNAGIYCQGALLRGHSQHAVRVAYMPLRGMVAGQPPLADCPQTEFCLQGMLANLPKEVQGNSLSERWARACEQIREKPTLYQNYLDDKANLLATLLTILVDLFDPSEVYLGGKSVDLFDLLLPRVEQYLKLRCPLARESGLELVHDEDFAHTFYTGMAHAAYSEWRPLAEPGLEG